MIEKIKHKSWWCWLVPVPVDPPLRHCMWCIISYYRPYLCDRIVVRMVKCYCLFWGIPCKLNTFWSLCLYVCKKALQDCSSCCDYDAINSIVMKSVPYWRHVICICWVFFSLQITLHISKCVAVQMNKENIHIVFTTLMCKLRKKIILKVFIIFKILLQEHLR